jgi:alkaline phosphatase D
MAACAQFLVRSNYTKASKLAIEGGSNGGLLMGAVLTQHPDLMQAVVSHVGIYDMLRVELDPNGQFNVTEFGTVQNPDQFRALYGYSPYHHVKDGVAYPAVLMMTGDNDGRVNPAHSRKMTARLQAASSSKRPILLRTSSGTGHGIGTALSERIEELADVYAFLFDQLGVDYSLVDRGPWSGSVGPESIVVKAKLAQPGMKARLVVSENALLTPRTYSDYALSATNRYDIVEFPMGGLKPDTQYYYALELDGRVEFAKRGEFKTFPKPGPASFTVAFASCARTGSTSDVFDRIRENHPLIFMHMGDFQYLDIGTDSQPRFRAAYDTVLASPEQSDMFRNIPLAYIWDDHDFGGNDSDRRAKSRKAARATYEEFAPHYPLTFESPGPICQTFTIGRVKFILTDLRSQRDPATNKDTPTKSMMGAVQKEWFKNQLLEANGKYPLICWVSSVPWIGKVGANVYRDVKTNQFGYIHHTNLVSRSTNSAAGRAQRPGARPPRTSEDHWSVYSNERQEIADFVKENHIHGLVILHGDSHMLAADDGSHSDYATGGGAPIPVLCAAPLDQAPSLKGGPYSQGVYRVREGEGCFGLLSVDDQGDHLSVTYSGRNNRNEEKMSLKFTEPVLQTEAKK